MIKVSTIIIAVLFALSSVYDIVLLIDPTIVLEGDFRAVTGKDYREVLDSDTVKVSNLHIRHMEVFGVTATILGFFVLFAAFRKGERWAWLALLIAGFICWGFGTVVNLVVGNMFDATFFVVGLAVYLVAIFLPVRKFFPRAT